MTETEKNSVLRYKPKKAVRVPFSEASFDIPPLCLISFPLFPSSYIYISIFSVSPMSNSSLRKVQPPLLLVWRLHTRRSHTRRSHTRRSHTGRSHGWSLQKPTIVRIQPRRRLFASLIYVRVPAADGANVAVGTDIDDGDLAGAEASKPLLRAESASCI